MGELPPGTFNAITDVPGVRVGHTTLVAGEGPLRPGEGPVRTGVTVVLPHAGNLFRQKVPAAVHTINGFGKACGLEQVRELGQLEAPLALTNTLNVGLVLDAMVQWACRQSPEIGIHASSVNVVVGETNDGFLNDIQGRHVHAGDVWQALDQAAGGAVSEGALGAGTGTLCFGWKGGIGTASRVLPGEYGGFTLGALVQTNFGRPSDLRVLGVPVGKAVRPPPPPVKPGPGSVMIVLATDAPLDPLQLGRLARRAVIGLARTGSHLSSGSGDFVIAFSTAYTIAHAPAERVVLRPALAQPEALEALFRAVMESVEEGVYNSLTMAHNVAGRDGHVAYALPLPALVELIK